MKRPFASESELLATVLAILPRKPRLTAPERKVVARVQNAPIPMVPEALIASIAAGADPLGESLIALRTPEIRRLAGAVYTPQAIVKPMLACAKAHCGAPVRVVDPGAGSGRFIAAAATCFPSAKLVAVETDPLAALVLRANAAVLGFDRRLTIKLADYREITLPRIKGTTLFIGNPPYVRHHDLSAASKDWYAARAKTHDVPGSKLAGLHLHFFMKTLELAAPGDYGVFITAGEWLDVNYGGTLRSLLANGLGGRSLHVIDAKARPFQDAMTTGTITAFKVGDTPAHLIVGHVAAVRDLGSLTTGVAVPWSVASKTSRWSTLTKPAAPTETGIELGDLFRVHRGQVTGANAVWIAGAAARQLPGRVLYPCVTRARELIAAAPALLSLGSLRRVVDLPRDLDELTDHERRQVGAFLAWARSQNAHESYVASHRKPWWSVRLREPAPVLVTYMGRRPPVFVRNLAKARCLNIAHGLYPREPISDALLTAVLLYLQGGVSTSDGRTYAGGLIKFEPRELERLRLPSLTQLYEAAADAMDASVVSRKCLHHQMPSPFAAC